MKKSVILMVLITIFGSACQNPRKALVNIHPDEIISDEFIGNGVQWSAYPHADSEEAEWGFLMTDEKWQRVFDRLDYMKPRMVRVMDQANWRYLVGFNEKGEPLIDYERQEVKSLQKLLDYCEKNDILVMIGEWGCPYMVNDIEEGETGYLTGANDPEWISLIVGFLDYLIKTEGYTCLKYYNLVNEPNGTWASTNGDWEEWKEGILMLQDSLERTGLIEHITIAGPDAVPGFNHPQSKYTGAEWAVEAVRQLDHVITCYDIHAYPPKEFVRSGDFSEAYKPLVELADSVNKPFIFGEIGFSRNTEENQKRVKDDPFASMDSQMSIYDFDYGVDMADVLIQSMNIGFDAVLAWDLDDAMHTLGDTGDKTQLKRWGMWNSLGTELCNDPDDENIRPWFYTWSLMCRYFTPEMSIVKTDTTGFERVRVVTGIDESDMTIAIVNNSDTTAHFNLSIPESDFDGVYRKYIYAKDNKPTDSHGFPVPVDENIEISFSKGYPVEIEPKSFMMLTSLTID